MQAVVSVIVPCYNVASTLDRALESARAQSLSSIEILVINDGSTDNTLAIAQRHAQEDARVRIIDKPNAGYGAACNRGLDEAQGTWIAILEPDDYLDPTFFESIVTFEAGLAQRADLVRCAYWRVFVDDHKREHKVHCAYRWRVHPELQPASIDAMPELLLHHPSIWAALYRRSYVEKWSIRFPEYPGAGWADNPFLLASHLQTNRIAYLDKPLYFYYEDSSSQALAFARKNPLLPLERWLDMQQLIEELSPRHPVAASPTVHAAQIKRGLTYCGTTIEAVGLNHPGVRSLVERIYGAMDADMVLSDPHITPALKRHFASVRGLPEPKASTLQFVPELIGQTLYRVRCGGLAYTLSTARDYLTRNKSADNNR